MFGMLARQDDTILQTHGKSVLTSARTTASSWVQNIRDICLLYQLPHPLELLDQPLPKKKFNNLVKAKVTDHWELKIRSKAAALTSAPYFKPKCMSLIRTHPIWSSCGPNPFECHKAVITTRMLSGRYLTDKLQRHWTHNKAGACLLPGCFPGLDSFLSICSFAVKP